MMSDQEFMTQIGASIHNLSSSFSPFTSISFSLDSMLSIGKKIITDVEEIRTNNKLIGVSREMEKAMVIIEEKVNNLKEREERANKVDKALKAREEAIAQHMKAVNEREAKLDEKEKRLEEKETELEEKEWQMMIKEGNTPLELEEREWQIKAREIVTEKIKENINKTPHVIKVHVGGDLFLVEKSTILKHPDSVLGVMLTSGKLEEGEQVFINRDPSYFPVILNFMRGYTRPEDQQLLRQDGVRREYDFYLGDRNTMRISSEKTLQPFIQTISRWIPRIGSLIYKASIDGMSPMVFHSLCDDKGPTLCIIQSNGHLFGGYAADSWQINNSGLFKNLRNPDTFIFTLSNPHGIPPTRYFMKRGNNEAVSMIHYRDDYGIWFGGTRSGNWEMTVDNQSQVGIFFPRSFVDTTGKGRETFTGKSGAQPIEEIWVYSV